MAVGRSTAGTVPNGDPRGYPRSWRGVRPVMRLMKDANGTAAPRVAEDGIITVGTIPFLLDKSILNRALSGE